MARIRFRANGKWVTFTTRPRRRGRAPKHLVPYLFKPKKASKRKGKVPPHLKPYLFKPGHRAHRRRW